MELEFQAHENKYPEKVRILTSFTDRCVVRQPLLHSKYFEDSVWDEWSRKRMLYLPGAKLIEQSGVNGRMMNFPICRWGTNWYDRTKPNIIREGECTSSFEHTPWIKREKTGQVELFCET